MSRGPGQADDLVIDGCYVAELRRYLAVLDDPTKTGDELYYASLEAIGFVKVIVERHDAARALIKKQRDTK